MLSLIILITSLLTCLPGSCWYLRSFGRFVVAEIANVGKSGSYLVANTQ